MSADLRAEFEAWAQDKGYALNTYPKTGIYFSQYTCNAWAAYQAAAHATARRCAEIANERARKYGKDDEAENEPELIAALIKSEFQEAFGEG